MNQRTAVALRAPETDNFRASWRECGISPKVGYKWKERFLQQGTSGMGDPSRRLKSSSESVGEEAVCRMVKRKERHRH